MSPFPDNGTLLPARHRIDTTEVPSQDRTGYWLDQICALYTKLECEQPQDDILGEIEFNRLGALEFSKVRSNVNWMRRTERLIRCDDRQSYLVMLQRLGRGRVCQDGREAILVRGDFVLYDTSRPYDLHFPDAHHEIIVLRVPHSELEPHVANLQDLTARTVPGGGAAGNLLHTMVDTLRRELDRLHPSSAMGVSQGITSIIGAGLRSLPEASQKQTSQRGAYHVARVKAFAMQELRNPDLTVAGIASALRISADHLSRVFREEPLPLSRWIWLQRLEACRRDLSDPRMGGHSVSQIAYSWGFNDASHFSRLFRIQFGVAPKDWRRQASGALMDGCNAVRR